MDVLGTPGRWLKEVFVKHLYDFCDVQNSTQLTFVMVKQLPSQLITFNLIFWGCWGRHTHQERRGSSVNLSCQLLLVNQQNVNQISSDLHQDMNKPSVTRRERPGLPVARPPSNLKEVHVQALARLAPGGQPLRGSDPSHHRSHRARDGTDAERTRRGGGLELGGLVFNELC